MIYFTKEDKPIEEREVERSTSSLGNIYGYTGREMDEESDLYYYRARYYNPGSGRFLSEDPIGFKSGDNNEYRYVYNNTLRNIDPSGLTYLDIQNVEAFLRQRLGNVPTFSVYNLPQGTSGFYNIATSTIYIDTQYTEELGYGGLKRLLRTYFHEYLHSVYGAATDEEQHNIIRREAQDFADNNISSFISFLSASIQGNSCQQ